MSTNPSVSTTTTGASLAEQLKLAWTAHHKHDNAQAMQLFQAIVEQDPTHIDANYGFGLALANLGQTDRAAEVFRKAEELVAVRISLQSADDEDARYSMLARMISQQLDLLNVKKG